MLSLTVHYIIYINFFFVHFIFIYIYIYILYSVVHVSLVKQCIFLCTLRSIGYVQIKIIMNTIIMPCLSIFTHVLIEMEYFTVMLNPKIF